MCRSAARHNPHRTSDCEAGNQSAERHLGARSGLSGNPDLPGLGHDEAMLVVVSGLPVVGKSELADALGQRLRAAVLSVDRIEAAMWRCGIAPSFETGVAAYEVVAVLAEHQLR